ncbi:MAG: alpha/beta fold hydrolase [Promethearchaeota archaeon]
MSELFADVNGIKLCYQIFGEGEPVVFVHGFGADKQTWLAQIPVISKDYKVIVFDNRGAGKSDRPKQKYTMETFADDIAGLLDFLKIRKAKAVIGWSLGGMIVQHFALNYPDRSEKIGLLFTNYKGAGGELYKKMRIEEEEAKKIDIEKAFWQSTKTSYLPKFRKQMQIDIKKRFYDLWSVEDLINQYKFSTTSIDDIERQAEALEGHNTFDRLYEIKKPTLLLAASHDRLTPKITMEQMHDKIPNSIFKVIEKSGHAAPISDAPEVNKILLEFLAS